MESKVIKPTMKQTNTEARIIALEVQLRIYSQQTAWGRTRGNPAEICQAMGGNCKELV